MKTITSICACGCVGEAGLLRAWPSGPMFLGSDFNLRLTSSGLWSGSLSSLFLSFLICTAGDNKVVIRFQWVNMYRAVCSCRVCTRVLDKCNTLALVPGPDMEMVIKVMCSVLAKFSMSWDTTNALKPCLIYNIAHDCNYMVNGLTKKE